VDRVELIGEAVDTVIVRVGVVLAGNVADAVHVAAAIVGAVRVGVLACPVVLMNVRMDNIRWGIVAVTTATGR
jgi:hypothetical protein